MMATSIRHERLAHLASVRVTGLLAEPARLDSTAGATPHALLSLHLQPAHGLPYLARMDLGCDHAARAHAEAQLPYLHTGALVSVAGDALELRTDHGHAALRVLNARALVIPLDPIPQPAQEGARDV